MGVRTRAARVRSLIKTIWSGRIVAGGRSRRRVRVRVGTIAQERILGEK